MPVQSDYVIKSWKDTQKYRRNQGYRKIAVCDNTILEAKSVKESAIVFYDTDIVTYFKNGRIRLNTATFMTKTTKDRMNQFSPFTVYRENRKWFVKAEELNVEFYDGITLLYDSVKGWQHVTHRLSAVAPSTAFDVNLDEINASLA